MTAPIIMLFLLVVIFVLLSIVITIGYFFSDRTDSIKIEGKKKEELSEHSVWKWNKW